MSSRLKVGKRCPIHGRLDCCGRGPVASKVSKHPQRFGVTYFPDGREKCTPAKLRERKDQLIKQGDRCGFCGEAFTDYRDVDLCHKSPKGSGGFKRDDSWSNIFVGHHLENIEQGSRTLDQYLAWRREKGLPTP